MLIGPFSFPTTGASCVQVLRQVQDLELPVVMLTTTGVAEVVLSAGNSRIRKTALQLSSPRPGSNGLSALTSLLSKSLRSW